jgi:uncharacterized protein with ParB-like and HNH nuclease domain
MTPDFAALHPGLLVEMDGYAPYPKASRICGAEMKTSLDEKSVSQLVELFKNKMLAPNPEYQRGAVWSDTQKKKLIDSVLRGYQLPLIYLHHIVRDVAGHRREDFEIIDGQQRINALYEFSEGAFHVFDPIKDDAKAKFPSFI